MIRTREQHGPDPEDELLTPDRGTKLAEHRAVGVSGAPLLDGARPGQDVPVDERTCGWLRRARALREAKSWHRVLGLANRGHRRGIRHPDLMALGGEAALHLDRPAEAIRLICWAQRAGLEERHGALSLLKGEALARLGTHATARRWLTRALVTARRAGARDIEARAADRLATLSTRDPAGLRTGRSSVARAKVV